MQPLLGREDFMEIKNTVGNLFKTVREEKGLTQEELGVLAKVTQGFISKIETGVSHELSVQNLKSICAALDIPCETAMTLVSSTETLTPEKDIETSIGGVFSTYEYDKFKFTGTNRNVEKLKKLTKGIKEIGHKVPIIVDEDYTILDGQHRFTILRSLNLPITFIFEINKEKVVDRDTKIININTTPRVWNSYDYLETSIKKGKTGYIELKSIMKELNMSVNCAYALVTGARLVGSRAHAFQVGLFNINDSQRTRVIKVKPLIKELLALDELNGNNFIHKALNNHMNINGFVDFVLQDKFRQSKKLQRRLRHKCTHKAQAFYHLSSSRRTGVEFKVALEELIYGTP